MTSDCCLLSVAQRERLLGLPVGFLTAMVREHTLYLLFTPRWISRKASSGVLFFWGLEPFLDSQTGGDGDPGHLDLLPCPPLPQPNCPPAQRQRHNDPSRPGEGHRYSHCP